MAKFEIKKKRYDLVQRPHAKFVVANLRILPNLDSRAKFKIHIKRYGMPAANEEIQQA